MIIVIVTATATAILLESYHPPNNPHNSFLPRGLLSNVFRTIRLVILEMLICQR
ncbi:hypothetical protein B0H11DRAFT_2275881 [Mycena galericulata]|nr:hypothetical protein B0H11DRAFT_2275881 [Mycena galericulata]